MAVALLDDFKARILLFVLHEISHFLGSKASFDPPGHKAGIFLKIAVQGVNYIVNRQLFAIRIAILIEILYQIVRQRVGISPSLWSKRCFTCFLIFRLGSIFFGKRDIQGLHRAGISDFLASGGADRSPYGCERHIFGITAGLHLF
ncbi:hypothetical protein D3C75_736280 [compost metagenome]